MDGTTELYSQWVAAAKKQGKTVKMDEGTFAKKLSADPKFGEWVQSEIAAADVKKKDSAAQRQYEQTSSDGSLSSPSAEKEKKSNFLLDAQEAIKEGKVKPKVEEVQGAEKKTPESIRTASVQLSDQESPSTVLMTQMDNLAFPTLFPKDPNKQTSDPKDWIMLEGKAALEEAKKRGEVWEFDSEEEAMKFAEGSWKQAQPTATATKDTDGGVSGNKSNFLLDAQRSIQEAEKLRLFDQAKWEKEQKKKVEAVSGEIGLMALSGIKKPAYLQAQKDARSVSALPDNDQKTAGILRAQIEDTKADIDAIENGTFKSNVITNPEFQLSLKKQQLSQLENQYGLLMKKARIANSKEYFTFIDTDTFEEVPMAKVGEDIPKMRDKFVKEFGMGNSSMAGEFAGKTYEELTEDQKRVIDVAFNSKYISKEGLGLFLASNNYDRSMGGVKNAINQFAKSGALVGSDMFTAISALGEIDKDVMQNVYDKVRYGLITKAEFQNQMSEINQYYQGISSNGRFVTQQLLPGVTPIAQSVDSLGKPSYTYSTDQVARMLSNMPTYEEIVRGEPSPFATPDMPSIGGAIGKVMTSYAESVKTSPELKESFAYSKVPQALGSSFAFLISGLATRGVGLPAALGSAMAGGLAMAKSQYDDAIRNGATPDKAIASWAGGYAMGTTEAVPIENMLKRMGGVVGWDMVNKMIQSGTEEAIQESFQTLGTETLAKYLYDETRDIDAALGTEVPMVAFVSGVLTAGFMNLASRPDYMKLPEATRKALETSFNALNKLTKNKIESKVKIDAEVGADKTGSEQADAAEAGTGTKAEPVKEKVEAEPIVPDAGAGEQAEPIAGADEKGAKEDVESLEKARIEELDKEISSIRHYRKQETEGDLDWMRERAKEFNSDPRKGLENIVSMYEEALAESKEEKAKGEAKDNYDWVAHHEGMLADAKEDLRKFDEINAKYDAKIAAAKPDEKGTPEVDAVEKPQPKYPQETPRYKEENDNRKAAEDWAEKEGIDLEKYDEYGLHPVQEYEPAFRGTTASEWEDIQQGKESGKFFTPSKELAETSGSYKDAEVVIELKPEAKAKLQEGDQKFDSIEYYVTSKDKITLDDVAKVYDKEGNVIYDASKSAKKPVAEIEAEIEALKDVESTISALNRDDIPDWEPLVRKFEGDENWGAKEFAEAYHKAKADGSNPELVAAVEEVLGVKPEGPAKVITMSPPNDTYTENVSEEDRAVIDEFVESNQGDEFFDDIATFHYDGENLYSWGENLDQAQVISKKELTDTYGLELTDVAKPEVKGEKVEPKAEKVVEVKSFKQGDGGTRGVFEGKDGQLYKSIEPQEIITTDKGAVRQPIKDAITDEHKILSELQDNPHIPKIGRIVNTTDGKAFEIEKLDEVDSFTKDEYREIQKILNDLNDKGYHVGDRVTVMKRPKTGELVIVDFSAGYKGDRMSRDAEDYMQNISAKLSKPDAIQIQQEDMAAHNRDMAEGLMKDESTTEYYLTRRPPSIGTHPTEGLKSIEETEYRGKKAWKLTYDKKLSADQVYKFELTPKITNKEFLGQRIKGFYGDKIFYVSDIDYKQGKVTLVSELNGKEISKDLSFIEFQKGIDEGKYKVTPEQPTPAKAEKKKSPLAPFTKKKEFKPKTRLSKEDLGVEDRGGAINALNSNWKKITGVKVDGKNVVISFSAKKVEDRSRTIVTNSAKEAQEVADKVQTWWQYRNEVGQRASEAAKKRGGFLVPEFVGRYEAFDAESIALKYIASGRQLRPEDIKSVSGLSGKDVPTAVTNKKELPIDIIAGELIEGTNIDEQDMINTLVATALLGVKSARDKIEAQMRAAGMNVRNEYEYLDVDEINEDDDIERLISDFGAVIDEMSAEEKAELDSLVDSFKGEDGFIDIDAAIAAADDKNKGIVKLIALIDNKIKQDQDERLLENEGQGTGEEQDNSEPDIAQDEKDEAGAVEAARQRVAEAEQEVTRLTTLLEKQKKALAKDLEADQFGMFDPGVEQKIFDDRAEINKMVVETSRLLDDAKKKLTAAKDALQRAEDAVGQRDMFTDYGKAASASSRFKPYETIFFDKPIVGPNGNKLISYKWAYEWTMLPNNEGELVSKRVSDWTQAESSAETGRDIVHQFTVQRTDGVIVSVSSETIPSLLGYVDADQMKNFPSLVSAVKTLAKQRMRLALLNAQQAEYDAIKDEVRGLPKPNIVSAEITDLPKIVQHLAAKDPSFFDNKKYWKTDGETTVVYRQEDTLNPDRTTKEQLMLAWETAEIEKRGGVKPQGLYDLQRRIERQEKKVEQIVGSTVTPFKPFDAEEEIPFSRGKSPASAKRISAGKKAVARLQRAFPNIRVNVLGGQAFLDKVKEALMPKFMVSGYHGSPFDFDRFSTDKIGTGEGAQAFGWGLYFTDLEGIARDYAEKLTGDKTDIKVGGIDLYQLDWRLLNQVRQALGVSQFSDIDTSQKTKNIIKKELKEQKEYLEDIGVSDYDGSRRWLAILTKMSEGDFKVEIEKPSKNLYEVSLHKGKTPDQYTWLEWDKPVSDDQIKIIEKQLAKEGLKDFSITKNQPSGGITGDVLYSNIQKDNNLTPKEASLFLLRAGIDGVKYPAESIATGATSDTARGFNYVVFDENAITIENKVKFSAKSSEPNKALELDIVNGFYSPLEKIIAESKQDKLPAKQWVDKFAKGEEAKWTGLNDWLSQQTGSVSKADILNFMKENRITVEIKVKGKIVKKDNLTGVVFRIEDKDIEISLNAQGGYDVLADGEIIEEDFASERGAASFIRQSFNTPNDVDYMLSKASAGEEVYNSDTKYHQYQLEGEKENYKEVLVTLPVAKSKQEYVVEQDYRTPDTFYAVNQKTGVKLKFGSYELAKSQAERLSKEAQPDFDKQFKSSHFEEPNIVVHLRMNTRTDAEGNKVLFLEEIQSDWGQKGKKEGFGKKLTEREREFIDEWRNATRDERARIYAEDLVDKYDVDGMSELFDILSEPSIPSAPFVTKTTDWVKLALKVAMQEAVAQGVDKIAWTTGEQQNDRYDLSKQVKSVYAEKGVDGVREGKYYIEAKATNGADALSGWYTPQELEGIVGKDLAEKISKVEDKKTFEGIDLKVGGKGMKGFYGSPTEGSKGIVGEVAEKLFGQKVGTIVLNTGTWKSSGGYLVGEANYVGGFGVYDPKGDMVAEFDTKAEADRFISAKSSQTQSSIDITPDMRAQVKKGLPLFNKAGDQILGFFDENTGEITLNEDVFDEFVALEEFGHLWTKLLELTNKPLYKAGIKLAMQHPMFAEINADTAYEHIWGNDEAVANEVVAKTIAGKGLEKLDATRLQRMKDWLKNFWQAVKEMLVKMGLKTSAGININTLTLNKLVDAAARELLSTTPITTISSEALANLSSSTDLHIGETLLAQINKGVLSQKGPVGLGKTVAAARKAIPLIKAKVLYSHMGAGKTALLNKERTELRANAIMAQLQQAGYGWKRALQDHLKEFNGTLATKGGTVINTNALTESAKNRLIQQGYTIVESSKAQEAERVAKLLNGYLKGEVELSALPAGFHEAVKDMYRLRQDLTEQLIKLRVILGDDIIIGVNDDLEFYLDTNFQTLESIEKDIKTIAKKLKEERTAISKLSGEALEQKYLAIRKELDDMMPAVRAMALQDIEALVKLKEWDMAKSRVPELHAMLLKLQEQLETGVGTITPVKHPRRKVSEAEKQTNKDIKAMRERLKELQEQDMGREPSDEEMDLTQTILTAMDVLESEGARPMTEFEFNKFVQRWATKKFKFQEKMQMRKKADLTVKEVKFDRRTDNTGFDLEFVHMNGSRTKFEKIPNREVSMLFGDKALDKMLITSNGYYTMPKPEVLINNRLYARMMANEGKYVHRSYMMHDRPDWKDIWKEVVPKDVQAEAQAWLSKNMSDTNILDIKVTKLGNGKFSVSFFNSVGRETKSWTISDLNMLKQSQGSETNSFGIFDSKDVKIIVEKIKSQDEVLHHLEKPTGQQQNILFPVTQDEVRTAMDILVTAEDHAEIMRGGKVRGFDSGIFKERQDIPEPLRKIMGEYEDPMVNYTKTITKMSFAIKQAEFVRDFIMEGGPWVSREKSATHSVRITKNDYFMLPAKQEWFVTKEAEALMKGVQNDFGQSGFAQFYIGMMAAAKLAHTIYYPDSQARNFWGAGLNMFATGNFRVDDIPQAIRIASQGMYGRDKAGVLMSGPLAVVTGIAMIGDAKAFGYDPGNKELQDLFIRATNAGVLNESINANVLRGQEAKLQGKKAYAAYIKASEPMVKAYEMSDNVFKVTQWLNEMRTLRKAYPEATQEWIDIEAGKIVRATTPTYSRLPAWTQLWSTNLPVGSFVSWPTAMIITRAEIMKQAAVEIASGKPVLVKKGLMRMSGMVAMGIMAKVLSEVTMAIFDWDDDEVQAIADLSPDFAKNNIRLYLSDDKVNVQFIDLTFVDPSSMFYRPIIAWSRAPGEGLAKPLAAMKEFASPYISTDMMIQTIIEANQGVDAYGTRVWNEYDTDFEKNRKKILHGLEAVKPQFINSAGRISDALQNEMFEAGWIEKPANDPEGKDYRQMNELANTFLGAKSRAINMQNGAAAGMKYSTTLQSSVGRAYRSNDKTEYSDYELSNERQKVFFDQALTSYNSMKVLYLGNGMSEEEARAQLWKLMTQEKISEVVKLGIQSGVTPELNKIKTAPSTFYLPTEE